jgi:hypothetical protein
MRSQDKSILPLKTKLVFITQYFAFVFVNILCNIGDQIQTISQKQRGRQFYDICHIN